MIAAAGLAACGGTTNEASADLGVAVPTLEPDTFAIPVADVESAIALLNGWSHEHLVGKLEESDMVFPAIIIGFASSSSCESSIKVNQADDSVEVEIKSPGGRCDDDGVQRLILVSDDAPRQAHITVDDRTVEVSDVAPRPCCGD